MFLFQKRKGNSEGVAGASMLCVLLFFYFCGPKIVSMLPIQQAEDKKDEVVQTVEEKKDEIVENSKNEAEESYALFESFLESDDTVEIKGYKYNSDKAKELLSTVEIAEGDWDKDDDGEGDYNRDEFEKPKKKFKSEYSEKTIGIKNYSLENSVKMAYDSEDFSYVCPYTGEEIKDAKSIDYDHIIPLAYVYGHGGSEWSNEKKNEYAFDLKVGVCSSASSNREKGARGPSEWMPKINQKWYCYQWLVIANEYGISIDQADYDVIENVFNK